MECMVSGYKFTYVVMRYKSTQHQSVGLIVVITKLKGLFMRQSKLEKVR